MNVASSLISGLLPVCSQADTLHGSNGSAAAQTCGPWERIVPDDGSANDTFSVMKPYRNEKRVRFPVRGNQHLLKALSDVFRLAGGYFRSGQARKFAQQTIRYDIRQVRKTC